LTLRNSSAAATISARCWRAISARRPAEAARSDQEAVHAKVGFGQLAWLRHDHDAAQRLMEEVLPTLRRLGDQRCTGRALYVLGERARQQQELPRAEELLRASIEAIGVAGQSMVLVKSLESLAAVLAAQNRPRQAAVLLGAAQTTRNSASVLMRPPEPPDEELRRSLTEILGTDVFGSALAEGERTPVADALRLVSAPTS
jgi:hypothetical protein